MKWSTVAMQPYMHVRTFKALFRALAADAPVRLPPAPIAKLGANLYLRWQECNARGEL